MQRLVFKSTLLLLGLGVGFVGVSPPKSIGLTQGSASISRNQKAELAEAERLHRQATDLYNVFLDEEKTVPFVDRVPKISSALSMQKQSLEIRQRILGDYYLDTIDSLIGVGLLLLGKGNYNNSEQVLQKCLALLKSIPRDESHYPARIPIVQNKLALVYMEQGNFDKAEMLLSEALKSRKLLSDKYNFVVEDSLYYLGLNHFKQKNYTQATQFFLEVYETHRKLNRRLGARESMYGLVEAFYYQENYERAIPYLEEMMEIEEQSIVYNLRNYSGLKY